MPTIMIDGTSCAFEQGETILQVANRHGITIPQYCYHDGLSIVASCRICLAEVWAPNPRNEGKLEAIPKLLPTCQTPAGDGQVVYTDSPKAIANQKSVMEYLLINHPLDCPVCDQSGECFLQDYSYEYGRGVSRFEESKVKQPKKNLGPHVYLYADRCIMCSRCVRFTREVTGTSELIVEGRGNQEQIDIFPGEALDNELSANVIDLCPVGALLDKDFLFTQRVWFLRSTPSIDGITAQGDNIYIEHNRGQVYRVKPRENMDVNTWWISDEIRYGYKFVHDENRLTEPFHVIHGRRASCSAARAFDDILDHTEGKRTALMVSPMLSCEDAASLAMAALELAAGGGALTLAVGPVPTVGADKTFPGGYTIRAEKAPNARGVRRVLEAIAQAEGLAAPMEFDAFVDAAKQGSFDALLLTGNYPSAWVTEALVEACREPFVALFDTLPNRLSAPDAEVGLVNAFIPAATWVEKAGVFENVDNRLQAFEQAIPPIGMSRAEGQIGLDLLDIATNGAAAFRDSVADTVIEYPEAAPGQVPQAMEVASPIGERFNAAMLRQRAAERYPALRPLVDEVSAPTVEVRQEADMEMVEL
jgi:NADH-quinone oxidoreductase subunit G